MSEVTLMHYTPGMTDLVMKEFSSVQDAITAAKALPEGRLAYVSIPSEYAPHGISLRKIERDLPDHVARVEPTGPQVTELHNTVVP